MNPTPEASLQVLIALIKRTPINEAEAMGAQYAVSTIESALKELADLKAPKNPEPLPTSPPPSAPPA